MQQRQLSPTGLTDAQWALLTPMVPLEKPRGRTRTVALRTVLNAIL